MIFEQWIEMFPEFKSWHKLDQKNLYKKYLRDQWTKNKIKAMSKEELLEITNNAIKTIPTCLTISNSIIKTYTFILIRKKFKCPY